MIPKSTNPLRIEQNARLWDWQLSVEDFERLSNLETQVESKLILLFLKYTKSPSTISGTGLPHCCGV